MPDEPDILEEGGPEPAVDAPEVADVDAEAPEAPAAAPITFTAEQLAEHLPQFQERFLAHHDPSDALRLYGERDRNVQAALTRYTQGAPTDADVETLRESGYEIPDQEPEPVEPLWGAPWAEPTTMDEFNKIAAERPWDALAFVDANPGRVNDDTRLQVLNYWAEHDRAAAMAYEINHTKQQQASEFKAMLDERDAALRQELTPIQQRAAEADHQAQVANVTILASQARQTIPDFAEHEEGVIALLSERADYDPTYLPRLFALPIPQQLQELNDLTGAAAWRARPAAQAKAEADAATAEQAKLGAAGQRGRGAAGASNSPQSDLKREHLASIERAVKARQTA